jgi:hypothetical protein
MSALQNMSFTEEHLVGRPELAGRVFEAAGLSLGSARGAEIKALCPFHPDHTPSLSVNLEKAVYICRAGCSGGDAVNFFALRRNISDADAIDEIRKLLAIPSSGPRRAAISAAASDTRTIRYRVCNAAGELKATHVRTEDPDGKKVGGMPWEPKGVKTAELPLYGSERLATADHEATVIVCEGEKATDSLLENGYAALGTVTGASGTPGASALEVLRDRDVVLWPDYDDVGRRHMRRVAASLGGIARSVRVLEWGEKAGDDAFDFFARGGTVEKLDSMLAEAPIFEDAASSSDESTDDPSVPADVVVSIGAFLAESPKPVPSILGDGVLCPGTLNLLAGEDGTGKTALALNLSLALAAGQEFLGLRVPRKAVVLFVEAEGNETHFRERVRAAAAAMGLDPATLALHFVRQPDLFAVGGEVLEQVIAQYRPDLVVFDTVGYFYIGDENSNSDWKQLVSKPLHQIARRYETAFLMIQHLSKPSETRTGKHRVRGGSAQCGDSDTVMTFDAPKKETGTDPALRVLSFEKVKNGPKLEKMVLRFDESKATFMPTNLDAVSAARPALGEVVRLVGLHAPVSWTALKKEVQVATGVAERTAESLISGAHDAGLIAKSKEGYRLPARLLPFEPPHPSPATAEPQPLKWPAVLAVPPAVTAEPQLRSFAALAVPAAHPFEGPSDGPCDACGDVYWDHPALAGAAASQLLAVAS